MALTAEWVWKAAAASAVIALCGCGERTEEPAASVAAPAEQAAPGIPPAAPVLAEVNQSIKSGALDDAAARLLELQASGRPFTAKEAAEYRKAMNEAYSRALEAAEKGDAKAKAAIDLIRAAGAR